MKIAFLIAFIVFISIYCLIYAQKNYRAYRQFKNIKALPVLSEPDILRLSFTVISSYPHDHLSFTQGLEWHEGILYESTGLKNRSSLKKIDIQTGKVLKKVDIPYPYFAEGITIFKDKIYQLTWKSQKCFVYDKNTFDKIHEFSYDGQGWGLTHNTEHLIMNDGTERLLFLDPDTFKTIRFVEVHLKNKKIRNINELEYINGNVFANIYWTNAIARIDPSSGRVTGLMDITSLYNDLSPFSFIDVPNGITHDPETNEIYITGKYWPKVFKVKIESQVLR
jgi:glutamine cyclotransferase